MALERVNNWKIMVIGQQEIYFFCHYCVLKRSVNDCLNLDQSPAHTGSLSSSFNFIAEIDRFKYEQL